MLKSGTKTIRRVSLRDIFRVAQSSFLIGALTQTIASPLWLSRRRKQHRSSGWSETFSCDHSSRRRGRWRRWLRMNKRHVRRPTFGWGGESLLVGIWGYLKSVQYGQRAGLQPHALRNKPGCPGYPDLDGGWVSSRVCCFRWLARYALDFREAKPVSNESSGRSWAFLEGLKPHLLQIENYCSPLLLCSNQVL